VKKFKSWNRKDFEEYRRTLCALEKSRDDTLRAKQCMNSGDTCEVDYFKLQTVLDFHNSFLNDMDTLVKIRDLVEELSHVN
jgi:hypothetical protein